MLLTSMKPIATLAVLILSIMAAACASAPEPVSDHRGYTTRYILEFNGFDPNEMFDIEDHLVGLSGYESHRPADSRTTRHVYDYVSRIGSAKLKRELYVVTQRLGMKVAIAQAQGSFNIRRISLPKQQKSNQSEEW